MNLNIKNRKVGVIAILFAIHRIFISGSTKHICNEYAGVKPSILAQYYADKDVYCVSFFGVTQSYTSIITLAYLILFVGVYFLIYVDDEAIKKKIHNITKHKIRPTFEKIKNTKLHSKEKKSYGSLNNYKIWKYLGLIIGVIWIGFSIYSRLKGGSFSSSDFGYTMNTNLVVTIIAMILRVFSAITCLTFSKVGLLPFNKYLWAVFGLILPPIALIVAGLFPIKNYN